VDKVETLTHYKFSLAFENSNEEDYVTEKFFQSLVAGMEYIIYLPSPHLLSFTTYSTYTRKNSCTGGYSCYCYLIVSSPNFILKKLQKFI
jgi:hypothetical protein